MDITTVSILVGLLTTIVNSNGESTNATSMYGGCLPNKTSCSVCYTALKQSLLSRDDNVQSLSQAFFPPEHNQPELVEVTYYFGDNISDSQVWFWTRDSSYLIFPPEEFQYLSLFFGKPAVFFTQKTILYLDEECSRVDSEILRLLTQRLRNFIEKAKFDPEIDEHYFARSRQQSKDDLDVIISNKTAIYIRSFFITGFLLTLIITIMLLLIYLNTKRWDDKLNKLGTLNKFNKYTQSKILSISFITFTINLYTVVLDYITIFKAKTDIKEPKVLTTVSIVVIVLDSIAFAYCILMCILGITSLCWDACRSHCNGCCIVRCIESCIGCCNRCCNGHCNGCLYICLALSTLGPVLSLAIHLPYVFIAYLNDASYATSIFIYYTITLFILFGAMDLSYGTCLGALANNEKQEKQRRNNESAVKHTEHESEPDENSLTQGVNKGAHSRVESNEEQGAYVVQGHPHERVVEKTTKPSAAIKKGANLVQDDPQDITVVPKELNENASTPPAVNDDYPMICCGKTGIIITFAIVIPLFTSAVIILMGMISAAIVVVPVGRSFGDAPDRLLGFYQTAIVLIGAYIFYRKFIKKTPSLESVIREFDTSPDLSRDEKLKEFYRRIANIVKKHGQ